MKKAGIIGGAGFIGSYITQVFLENGFEVRVSATDPTKEEKYKHLSKLANADKMELAELNVENKDALKSFVTSCQIVVHCGTPFILDVQDPQTQLFEPTIKGTENFLDVIRITPGVEKVIFIASVAAYNTNFPLLPDGKAPGDTIDEEDTKFMSELSHPYCQAKFIANQTVENFIRENADIPFEICSVSPVFVMGDSLSTREDSTSGGLQYLFKNKLAPDPFVQMLYDNDVAFAVVGVEDVARSVYKAAITPGVHGKNYILSSETYNVSDLGLMLNGQPPKNEPVIVYKNDLAKSDLDVVFSPVKTALIK